MRKLFLFLVLLPMMASAYDYYTGGIYYDLDTSKKEAKVTYKNTNYNSYSGDIVIPSSITYNGTPYSVTSIGSSAFYGCSGMTSVTIGNNVTSIGSAAFYNCSGLKSVTIGNSVTSIGNSAFYGCSGLTSITIPNSVTRIGSSTFYGTGWYNNRSNGLLYLSNWLLGYKGYKPSGALNITDGTKGIADEAFDGCTDLKSVTIPNSVTSIGKDAFEYCSGLTSVNIPNSVTSIGNYAFYGCSGLTSITIPNSVTSIGSSAFYGTGWYNNQSDGLLYLSNWLLGYKGYKPRGALNITDGTKGIADEAFYGCTGLTSVTIPNSVTSIGNYAFYGCSSLTEVTCLAKNVPQTGNNVFQNVSLSNATLIVRKNSISAYKSTSPWKDFGTISQAEVDMSGFYYFFDKPKEEATLVSPVENISGALNIPSYVVYEGVDYDVVAIDDKAFEYRSGLTAVTIPNSITSIGDDAFSGCTGLTSISLSKKVKSIGRSPFKGCRGLTSIVVNSGNTVYDSRNNCNAIIETATGKLIQGCNTTVIPDDVTSIGDYAFYNCSGLSSVNIPNSVTSIGEYAFYYCSSLNGVYISDLTSWCKISFERYANPLIYAKHLYLNGEDIQDLVIPNNVTAIANRAFQGYTGLSSVNMGNNVTSIGLYVFQNCTNLTSVTIGNSVASIGTSAFERCSSLTSVTINSDAIVSANRTEDDNINNIFGNQVKEYVIGDEVTSIGQYAFYGCSSMTSVTIPNSVTSIGSRAFNGCSSLTSVSINSDAVVSANRTENENLKNIFGSQVKEYVIGDDVTAIGDYAFNGCNSLTTVTIGNSVTSIGKYAFNGCQFASVVMPNSVTSIGENAFRGNTNLTTVSVGKNISSIGDNAFYGCSNMKTFTCYAVDIPTANSSVFEGIDLTGATLYVPASALEDYEDTKPWKRFGTILPIDEGSMPTDINAETINGFDDEKVTIYDLNGRKHDQLRPGINIIRQSDGTTRKVMVK